MLINDTNGVRCREGIPLSANKKTTSYFPTPESLIADNWKFNIVGFIFPKIKMCVDLKLWSNFINHYFRVCAMANRSVINIVPANNVLLPQRLFIWKLDFSTNDWGIFRYPGCLELVGETKVDKEMHLWDKRTSVWTLLDRIYVACTILHFLPYLYSV